MDSVTQIIGQLLLNITILIIGIEGVMSLLDRLGFLPIFLERFYITRDKRTVMLTINELGLIDKKPILRQALEYWRSESLTTNIDTKTTLTNLIAPITRELKSEVGLYKKVKLQYYVDLAEHTTDWNKLDMLAKLICSDLRKNLAVLDSPIRMDKIAAPPGNPALAIMVAVHMQKPFISVTPISPLSSDPVSGKIEKDDEVVIIHDVVLTGFRLADVANAIRSAGGKVKHAFVLVERTDSKKSVGETPSETLLKNGVSLHSILSVNDDSLAAILKKRR